MHALQGTVRKLAMYQYHKPVIWSQIHLATYIECRVTLREF